MPSSLNSLEENSKKTLAVRGLIFVFFIFILSGFIVLFSFLSRSSYTEGLKNNIKTVTEKSEDYKNYKIGEELRLLSPLSNSSHAFRINNQEEKFFVISRIQTYYGPQCAVFFYDLKNSKSAFLGFSCIKGKAEKSIEDSALASSIPYWQKKIEDVLASSIKNID